MPIPQEALELENRSIGEHGEPTLSKAYAILKKLWDAGDRDRELGLHLMFLSWYGIIEPSHITGFDESIETVVELNQMLKRVHAFFEPVIQDDAEMLYAFGLVAKMFGFMFDDSAKWEKVAEEYRTRYRLLAPDGIDVALYEERGAYGDYYAMQAGVTNGY